ncbi:hypothetical protein ACTSKR_03280 [Chitinibacteraceae bacterium HSL-7]
MTPTLTPASASEHLRNTVLINENIKSVIVSCFEINLMGLNAILLAKQAGEAARGFGVISGELRQLSLELQRGMQRLAEQSQSMLVAASRCMTQNRRQQLLSQTAKALESSLLDTLLDQAMETNQNQRSDLGHALEHSQSALLETLADAHQSLVYGQVLARAARIESAYAGAHAGSLTELSNEFARKVDAIVPRMETLTRIVHA